MSFFRVFRHLHGLIFQPLADAAPAPVDYRANADFCLHFSRLLFTFYDLSVRKISPAGSGGFNFETFQICSVSRIPRFCAIVKSLRKSCRIFRRKQCKRGGGAMNLRRACVRFFGFICALLRGFPSGRKPLSASSRPRGGRKRAGCRAAWGFPLPQIPNRPDRAKC